MIGKRKAHLIRQKIELAAEGLSDEDALEAVELFPWWDETAEYKEGKRVRYGDLLYKCISNHQAQPSWAPDISPSIWVRIDDPAEEWPEWRQPTGATDAYRFGAKVSHNGKHWISGYDNNTWEPGVFGWNEAE